MEPHVARVGYELTARLDQDAHAPEGAVVHVVGPYGEAVRQL